MSTAAAIILFAAVTMYASSGEQISVRASGT